jgi:hypothetical protein
MKKIAVFFMAFCFAVMGNTQTKQCYYVKANGDDGNSGLSEEAPFQTLAKAIGMAASGDIKIITVLGTINSESEKSINTERIFTVQDTGTMPIIIRGIENAGEEAVITAQRTGRGVIQIRNANIIFEHIIISGGESGHDGGGILALGSQTRIVVGKGARIVNNKAVWGGGVAALEDSTVIMSGGKIDGNFAEQGGGGILSTGIFIMKSGTISGNHAVHGGAAVLSGRFSMYDGDITNNHASLFAGGFFLENGGTGEIYGGRITGNTAVEHSGGAALAGSCIMNGGEISGNQANYSFGGLSIFDSLTMNGGRINGNQSMSGGGIAVFGAFIMNEGEIRGNYAYGGAGGVFVASNGIFIMKGGKIAANQNISGQSNGKGGGVVTYGSFTISGGEISDNQAFYGGGVYIDDGGSCIIEGGDIKLNQAYEGGGIYINNGGVFTHVNGLVTDNGSEDGINVKNAE